MLAGARRCQPHEFRSGFTFRRRQRRVVRPDDEQGVLPALLRTVDQPPVGFRDEPLDVRRLVGEDRQARAPPRTPLPSAPSMGKSWTAMSRWKRSKTCPAAPAGGGRAGPAARVLGLARALLFPEDDGELVAADAGDQVVLAGAALSGPRPAARISSPTPCPKRSLYFLKSSMSNSSSVTGKCWPAPLEDGRQEVAEVAGVGPRSAGR